jgi:hypothetical protein
MHIANFTPDEITWTHGGIIGILKEGDVEEFDNARGNHILNKYGQRGLVQLQYGDDEEEVKRLAMKVYKEFWYRQITNFNRQNETLRNENKAYIFPQKVLEEKAKEFSVELIGPWKVNLPSSDKEMVRLQQENRELRSSIDDMQSQMKELIKIVKSNVGPKVMEKEGYMKQFKNMSFPNFRAWAKQNIEKIEEWPDEVKEEIRIKWVNGKYDEICPI